MGAGASRNGHKLLESVPGTGIVVVPPSDEEAALTTMVRSFCGYGTEPEKGLDFLFWPLKGHEIFQPLPQQSDGTFHQDPDHLASYRWLFRYCLYEMRKTGLVFGIKKEDGSGYAALMLCRPPGYHETTWSMLTSAYKAGLTPPWEAKKGPGNEKFEHTKARMDGVMKTMTQCHKECCPEKHWYIYMLQVDPSCQGKGLGKRLLNFVSTLADRRGVPVYLETVGDRNVKIYEKMGFNVVKSYTCMVGMDGKIGGPGLTEGGGMTAMKKPPAAK